MAMIGNFLWFMAGYLYCTYLGAPTGALALKAWDWIKTQAAKYGIGRGPG